MPEYIPREQPVSDVRRNLAELVNNAAIHDDITYLTVRGRRYAALVPVAVADEEVRRRNSAA